MSSVFKMSNLKIGLSNDDTNDVNIEHRNPVHKILINGVEPGGGGGASLPISGTGNIDIIGDITATTLSTTGDIQTTTGTSDIVSGRNFYFDGTDIFKRDIVGGVATNTSYTNYKQLAIKDAGNTFTGANKFNDNITEFADKVSVGTRDAVTGLFTQNLALNKSGNIESKTINNTTQITCGSITCDNGPDNECKARVFNTRTSGTNGWNIQQQKVEANAPANAGNNILQIAATQAQAAGIPVEVYITSSEFNPSNGDNPNIKLIPSTVLNGGRIQAAQFDLGTAGGRYYLKQDIGGPLNDVLQIKAPTAAGEVHFQDNLGGDTLKIKNASVDLKNDIPLNFGAYLFRPQQYTYNFTNAVIDDNPTVLFNSSTTLWTNVNAGGTSTLANIGNNFFKITIIGVPTNSAGVYGNFRWSGDFPFLNPAFPTGTVMNKYDGNFSIIKSPAGFTKPEICGYSSTSTDYKLCFPSVPSGTDTYSGTIRITILNT